MASVQYVGFPTVLPKVLIKYGYEPTRDGYLWTVAVFNRETGVEKTRQYATPSHALGAVEALVKYYGG